MLFVMLNNPSVQPSSAIGQGAKNCPKNLYDWCGATPWLTMQKSNAVGCPIYSGISSNPTESCIALEADDVAET
jgi:hypothetical protein